MPDEVFNYWYPMYPARFKKKTLHLTIIQRAIYRELIDFYMETRSALPNSDIALARIVGISVEDFTQHSVIIRAFFKVKKDTLFHPTCDGLLRDQEERAKNRKEKSSKGGKAKAEKNKSNQGQSFSKQTSSNAQPLLGSATGQDSKEQDKTRKKDPTLSQPSVYKPPLPPEPASRTQSAGSGGFKKMGGVLGKMGLGSGSGAFSIREHLSDYELREMLVICPGWDRNELFRQYNEWVATKGAPRSPRAAFLAWCKKKPRNP